jgi:excisionase family DNA binding protein
MRQQENPNWQPDAPLMFSVFQTHVLLGLCEKTIRNLIDAGELTARRVGDRLLIPRSSIESFIKRDHVTRKEK